MSKKKQILIIGSLLVLVSFFSCILFSYLGYRLYKEYKREPEPNLILSDSIEKFSNDSEFDKYAEDLTQQIEAESDTSIFDLFSYTMPMTMESEEAGESEEAKDTITNVQEAGVDEGDIVKAYNDYLVILRRGKIFTVKLEDDSTQTLETVSVTNAYPEGFTQGTWYDEMLIYNDTIIVIGYTYYLNATEIGIFDISENGIVTHKASYFIDSNDYYSSRNYTSRLVEEKLIFYMPYYLYSYDYETDSRNISFPKVHKWINEDNITEGKDILDKTDIYKPLQDTLYPTLHTVVECDLSSSNFVSSARAIIGPYSRSYYVSPNAVYIWVAEGDYYTDEDSDRDYTDAYVYRLSLSEDTAHTARAAGTPIDQFSFKEKDGYLNVLLREEGSGDAMWNSEFTSGQLAFMRTSLENFSNEANVIPASNFTILPEPEGYTLQNKYVGDYLIYGTGSNWYGTESEQTAYIKNITDKSETSEVALSHSVDRIEALGLDSVIIGTNGNDLQASSISLEKESKIKSTFTIKNAVQGELRSHGFYYKSGSNDTGIIGLPIRKETESYEHLFNESAEIIYLYVDSSLNLSDMGSLEANPPREENDNCEVSCVDWYGNSRPIFYNERIFALMGYEIVEGSVDNQKISEINRLNYSRR